MNLSADAPIGIFDSGIGGLTVARAVKKRLPNENIVYFGDTARVPYGIKSPDTVKEFALQITDFLLKKNVKIILIACNTVAASAGKAVVKRAGSVPVINVVTAGAYEAVRLKGPEKMTGIIGTLATVGSGAYDAAIRSLDEEINVFGKACPLLVPLAEEGWTDNEVARKTIAIYLNDFKDRKFDSLILGCTHFPVFKSTIEEFVGDSVGEVIDSADAIAEMTYQALESKKLLNPDGSGQFDCYVSDKPQRFQALAERFLGSQINRVEIVNMR